MPAESVLELVTETQAHGNTIAVAQHNGTSNAEIARKVGLAPSAVFERIRKLEEKGIIRGYHADVDPRAVELGQLAFMFIRSNDRPGAVGTAAQLSEVPEILELHHVAGEDCFLAKAAEMEPRWSNMWAVEVRAGIRPGETYALEEDGTD